MGRPDVVYWLVVDPTGFGATAEARGTTYRQTRDQIARRIRDRFGPLG